MWRRLLFVALTATLASCDAALVGTVWQGSVADASDDGEVMGCEPDPGFCGVCTASYPLPGPPNVVLSLAEWGSVDVREVT